MRFDDRLATVLAQPHDHAAACVLAWRQIVDLLAQRPMADGPPPAATMAVLARLNDHVPPAARAAAAAALAGRRVHPAVVALLAGDRPSVAAVIGGVRLEDAAWLFLLPRLPVAARALLRRRRDLSPMVRIGLACFGPSDFALPPAAPPREPPPADTPGEPPRPAGPSSGTGGGQAGGDPPGVPSATIPPPSDAAPPDGADVPGPVPLAPDMTASLSNVALSADEADAVPSPPAGDLAAPAETFRFETGPDGVILWVDGAPRAALVGATIAQAAGPPVSGGNGEGVDGQAAGAFRHQGSFRDARLVMAGGSAVAGEWRIAGVPAFDPRDGRFTGYRGVARRPRDDRHDPPAVDSLYDTGLPAESLRLLVHELRTPLNAIVGFGEMIERQILGPAALRYRVQAGVIVEQGRRLLGVVDDLDMAARAAGEPPERSLDPVAPTDLLRALWRAHRPIAADRGVLLEVAIGAGIGTVEADPAAIERMYARLLAAAIGLGRPGERIVARLGGAGGAVVLWLTRPAVLGDSSEATLLDPGFTPEGDWPDAPLLGLGFSLRLVRNLAMAAGGGLAIEPDGFVLHLPVAAGRKANGATPR